MCNEPLQDLDDSSELTDLSSDLSSTRSLSPPINYPSPASTQERDASPPGASLKRPRSEDDGPSKKRRKATPKPRTTQYLNLNAQLGDAQKEQCDLLLKILRKRRKIVVIAGAGISVAAGIPDFRSSTGLFSSLRSEHKLKSSGKHLFDASVYQTDSSTSSFHDMVRSLATMVSAAKPTAFHQMLSSLATEGRLLRLYTQNVDGIDTALPSLHTSVPLSNRGPWPTAIQLHGGLEKMVCTKCGTLSEFAPELFNGPSPPLCQVCVEVDRVRTKHAGKRSHGIGRLRPRIVLYNEHNPDEEAIGAVVAADLRARPDAVIVVGTSMKIPGVRRIVREMCGVVRARRDGLAVWLNRDPPPVGKEFECWDLIAKGPCDEVARLWAQPERDAEAGSQKATTKRSKLPEPSEYPSTVDVSTAAGIPTPLASPKMTLIKTPAKIKIILKVGPPEGRPTAPIKPNVKASVGSKAAKAGTKKARAKGVKATTEAKIDSIFKQAKATAAKSSTTEKTIPSTTKEDRPHAKDDHGLQPMFPNLRMYTTVGMEAASRLPKQGDGNVGKGRLRRLSEEIIIPAHKPKGLESLIV